MTSLSASSSRSSVYIEPTSSDEEIFFPRSQTPPNPSLLHRDNYDNDEELPASIRKPEEENCFKTAWKTTLPAWLLTTFGTTVLNAVTLQDRFIEVISSVSLGVSMRLYSQYNTPKKVAKAVNPFIAPFAAEALFIATNIRFNIDNLLVKTAIRTLSISSAGYFFTHNTMLSDKQREENLTILDDTPRTHRYLCLGKNGNKILFAIHYSALIAIGSTFIALGVKNFDESKIQHLDLDGGTLLLSYALGDLLSTIGFSLYDKCINPENRRYVKEIMRHSEGPKGITIKERVILTSKRFLGAMASAIPGILLPLSSFTPHIPLAYAALGAFGGAKRVYDARVYERYDPRILDIMNSEGEEISCCKMTARKVKEHVLTSGWFVYALGFAIWSALDNDMASKFPMLAFFIANLSGYALSRGVDHFARKYNNRLINQLDFDLHGNGLILLIIYLLWHTKFGLLDTDFNNSTTLEYALMMFLYVLLGLNFGVNRGRAISMHNTSPESTPLLGLAQLSNNAMQYALMK